MQSWREGSGDGRAPCASHACMKTWEWPQWSCNPWHRGASGWKQGSLKLADCQLTLGRDPVPGNEVECARQDNWHTHSPVVTGADATETYTSCYPHPCLITDCSSSQQKVISCPPSSQTSPSSQGQPVGATTF